MASLGELTAFLKLEAQQYQKGITTARDSMLEFAIESQKTQNALQSLSNQTGVATGVIKQFVAAQAATKQQGLGDWFNTTSAEINSFVSMALRGVAVLHEIFNAVEEAARTDAAAQYFFRAGNSIEQMREATHGLLSDAEIYKKTNIANELGLTSESIVKLAQVARMAAASTGQSYEYVFDTLLKGTETNKRILLEHSGILVSAKDANLAYAKSLKETDETGQYANETIQKISNSLTAQGREHALLQYVLDTSQDKLQKLADVGATSQENFDHLKTALENVKLRISNLIADGDTSPVGRLAFGLQQVANALEKISKFGSGGILNVLKGGLQGTAEGAIGFAQDHPLLTAATGGAAAAVLGGAAGGAAGALSAGTDAANQAEDDQLTQLRAMEKALTDAGINLKNLAGDTKSQYILLEQQNPALATTIEGFIRLNAVLHDVTPAVQAHADAQTNTTTGGGAHGAGAKDIGEGASDKGFLAWIQANFQTPEEAAAIKEAHQRELDGIEDEIKANKLRKQWADEDEKARQHELQLRKEWEVKVKAHIDEMNRIMINAAGEAGKDLVTNKPADFFQNVATIIGAAFDAPELGKAIGEVLGPLIAGLQPVITLFQDLANGLGGLISIGLTPFLEVLNPLGPALEILLKVVGVLVLDALQPLIPVLALVVNIVTLVIDALSFVVITLAPFVQVVVELTAIFMTLGGYLLLLLGGKGTANIGSSLAEWLTQVQSAIIDAVVYWNNAIVTMFQDMGKFLQSTIGTDLGLSSFGNMIDASMFQDGTDATVDNTTSTDSNTKAVQQLSRDFRNMPSGYKVNYPIYTSTAPKGIPGLHLYPLPAGIRDNFRIRL